MREMKHSMRKAGTALLSALFVLPLAGTVAGERDVGA